ncbi:glycoside hydrolase family 16 protein, partial [Granulosicoccus sp.]
TGLRWDGEYNGERYEYRVVNGENQFYVNIFSEDEEHIRDVTPSHNPFEFDGSRLAIRAIKNPLKTNNGERAFGPMRDIVSQQDFLSGAITTHDKFSQKFGYFEARIKIPSHVGSFPAFWLFHENRAWEGTQRSEIDIMENLGHAPWYVYNSFHYFKNVSTSYSGDANFVKPYPSGQIYTGTDYSQDYHVYAVEWQPGKVTWLIDGEKVSELEHNEVNFEELYVKLNLAMGGNWTNYPANSGGLGRSEDQHYPNQDDLNNFNNPALEIDYVRVYGKR